MASLYSYEEEQIEQIPNQVEDSSNAAKKHQTPQFHSNLHKRTPLTSKRDSNLTFISKNQQYLNIRKERINHLKAQIQEKTMADCTFQPSINRSKSKNSRNLQQFLDFQANHIIKIDQKNQMLKQRIENEKKSDMTFSPKINRKKNNRNKQNVHERLYKLKDNNKQFIFDEFNHIPKITAKGEKIARNIPVQELLYLDAKRRQHKQNTQAIQADKPDKIEKQTSKNNNNSKFAAQKFLKDFNYILQLLNLQNNAQFSQEQFIDIMKHLGFIRFLQQQNNPLTLKQKQIIKEAHQYLSEFKLTQSSMYVFLLAVGGIYDIEVGDGTIIQQSEGKKIHGYFDLLFRNRLFNDYAKKISKSPSKQVNSFRPMINPDSSAMADKYRCKMIEKANDIFAKNDINIQIPEKGLAHEDLLVIYNLSQNLEKQKLRDDRLQKKDPQCTFQPNHEKYQDFLPQNMGKQKCQQLYEQAKFRQIECNKLSNTITANNTQRQNHKRSTLSPKASNVSKNTLISQKGNIKSYLQIKDIDKTMARMVLGRQIKNQKKQLQERGQPIINKKYTKRITKAQNERQLLLDVDVSINNVYKKILIYSDDKGRIGQVVSAFSKKQGLDSDSNLMLQQQLRNAINQLQSQETNNFFSN